MCRECVIKHLSQAWVLTTELRSYPSYFFLIVGHLAEAERESDLVVVKDMIRESRRLFFESGKLEIERLVVDVCTATGWEVDQGRLVEIGQGDSN